ncbi:proclotting enzyme-like isoform X1 [Hylaeus anthracinus]|uniref:proclotting enzyme-like isoform X1 n=1 Tax=Hylaeus anthracinus TaxID=313031 RepID=UPI0023B9F2A6|nr:proclotting enzyme-like isoform X1 [Hylaeus anthracinus]
MYRRTFFLCVLCSLSHGRFISIYDTDSKHTAELLSQDRNLFVRSTVSSASSSCDGPSDKGGRCEYLVKCFIDEYRSNFELAMNHSCTIDGRYLGACCPDRLNGPNEENSVAEDSFTSILPLVAVVDEESNESKVDGNAGRIVWQEPDDASTSTEVYKNSERSRGCGTNIKTRSRLVGGRPADPKQWPWMVALLKKDGNRYCGGVLVTDRHILTAAHCVYRYSPRDIKVRLGEYDFSTAEETRALDLFVSEIRVHPDFDYTTYDNDIAILKLHRPTVFNDYIWPICLPPIDQTFENKNAIVTGWGSRFYGGPASAVLMEVSVPIWKQERCVQSFVRRIPRTVICAGAYEGGRDACQGDSGGPLLHQLDNGRWINVGIVSWGMRCGVAGRPGIYTRVSSYLDWIFQNAVF